MNERKYIENISREDFCKKMRYNITLLVKKFYEETSDKKEIVEKVLDYMDNIVDDFMEEKWIEFIEKVVNKVEGDSLNCVEEVYINNKEIELLRTLGTRNEKCLLFTLMVLAKMKNQMNENNNCWVSYSLSDIFKVANIKISRVKQGLLVKELRDRGFIEYATKIDNLSLKVVCLLEGEEIICIKEMDKLGNIYHDYERVSEGYKKCIICGKTYKPKSPTHMYCNKCRKDKDRELKREWWDKNKLDRQ